MNYEDFKAFKKADIFQNIDDASLKRLAGSLTKTIRIYKKNALLLSEDASRDSLGILLKGRATVYGFNAENRKILLTRLSPSHVFGLTTLFHGNNRFLVEITAASECRSIFLSREQVAEIFSSCPQVAVNYASLLTARIHHLIRQVIALSCDDFKERLHTFLSLYPFDKGTDRVDIPFNPQEIAPLLNISKPSLMRLIKELSDDEVLEYSNDSIHLLKAAKAFQ
ncbi:MAG: Crp/Fnr family transcriptional regulator [Oscillospiraceae bacterium]|jgi:CRP-like cAMP-binding protein|nr:Crp/Fnr family transcriptional regulator [Oscillospiraceae bacterium]